jgi:hypothetical protein
MPPSLALPFAEWEGCYIFGNHCNLDAYIRLDATFNQFSVPQAERDELIAIVESARNDIVVKSA